MQLKRIIALVLALAVMAAFAACGEKTPDAGVTDESEVSAGQDSSAAADAENGAESEAEVKLPLDSEAALALGLEPTTTIISIEDSEVSWRELAYWLDVSRTYYEYYYGVITDWDEDIGGMTVSEYILFDATEMAMLYHAVEVFCESQGVELSEADIAEIEAARADDIEYYGGEEAYREALERDGLDEELFYYMNTVSCLYNTAFEQRYGKNGELCPDDEVMAYAELYNYMCAKHILLKTEDKTETERAEILAQAQQLLEQINASADPAAEFEKLLAAYGEDEGMLSFPDGYTFGSGEMVAEFEAATAALEPGGISSIVESTYGYHIIMRLPLSLDGMTLDGVSLGELLRVEAALNLFDAELAEFIESCEIVYRPLYESIDAGEMLGSVNIVSE